MKFRTKYDKTAVVESRAGDRIQPEYVMVIKEDGTKTLEKSGCTDVQALINSHKDSVDINLIMARVKNGETDLLERAKGFYADVTELPCNLQDAMNLGLQGERFFDSLPPEIRENFSSAVDMINNPERLFKAIEDMSKVPEQKQPNQNEPIENQPDQKQPEQKQPEQKGDDE